jgi:undecaprenyl-diphosphatase
MGSWLDGLTGWLTAHPQWLGLAIFLVACVECLAIAGLIVPGTVVLFAVAVLAGHGALSLGQTLLLGYAGGLLGDALSYAIGRRYHQDIKRIPLLARHPQWMESAENYFHRYGVEGLLIGRFIGPLRPMLPLIAGMLEMPLIRFALVSLLAAAGWSIAYLLPGWATGAAFRLPLPPGFWPEAGAVAAGLAIVVGLSINSSLRRHTRATLWVALMSLAMLMALLIGWPYLTHLDNGLMQLVQEHRSEAMDPFVAMTTAMGDFRTQFMLATAVVAILAIHRQWRLFIFAMGAMLGTALCNAGLKMFFARGRPEVLIDPLTSYSMPSGHSSASFALFLTLALLAGFGQAPRMRIMWLVVACIPASMIAASRIYLGVHWPTDVLAGAMLACCLCAASLASSRYFGGSMPAVAGRIWWWIVPVCAAILGWHLFTTLPHAMQHYQYGPQDL